eukprot:CAMPEP_0175815318 /NCGR_PEP_ID=MMETSP0107_2-20121207/5891_1 /TAXON_ID=195067 ORGANISM="Goniomonas pacifica, Strain CCMP1869" /NCGR_SAMPLE_ID=MMETSP0107_2 /ASSEMBLY_ACC=CAM_ASM_000203 /LENGTH=167 /DNA_ID=CAMNT_0017127329 /DNA_START=140 /DNA_END=643 /DNA_ORIENTATION=+
MTRLLCHGTDKYEEAGRLLRRLLAEPENKEHVLSVRHALDDLEGIKFFCVQASFDMANLITAQVERDLRAVEIPVQDEPSSAAAFNRADRLAVNLVRRVAGLPVQEDLDDAVHNAQKRRSQVRRLKRPRHKTLTPLPPNSDTLPPPIVDLPFTTSRGEFLFLKDVAV